MTHPVCSRFLAIVHQPSPDSNHTPKQTHPDSVLVLLNARRQFVVVNPIKTNARAESSLGEKRSVVESSSVFIRVHPWLKNLFLAACFMFVPIARGAEASTGDYLIDVWTRERGLPNSSVTAIAQTADGYLWVGTYNGLARFDGQRCVNFFPENTPELKNARVRRLFTTPDGMLWINTYDGSITSHRGGRFTFEWLGSGSADALVAMVSTRSNRPVFLLHTGELIRWIGGGGTNNWETLRPPGFSAGSLAVEDGSGAIWGRNRDQKLWRLKGSGFEAIEDNGGLEGATINYLVADAAGKIWAGTDKQIAVWDGTRFQSMTPTNGEAVLNTTFLRVLPNGDVWSVANDRVRKAHGREWVFEIESARGVLAGTRDRTGLHVDESGGVWLYDYGRGIFHVRADGRVRQLATEENFPGERVDCFHEDREGNFWAGVDRGGLVRVREKRFTVMTPGSSTAARTAVSVTEDADGGIWVGTFGGGLHRWWNNEWRAFQLPGGLRRGFVFSVCPDANGRVWVSAGEEDLFFGNESRFTQFNPAVHGVKTLLTARDGRLWIGTKGGLAVVSGSQFKQFYPEDGVARTDIRALAEDGRGAVWAGAGDGTLYRVELMGRTNRVTTFRASDALGSQPIWSLLAETNGTIWVGTFRGGLLRVRGGEFTRYTTKDGLPDDVICQILSDDNGRLWVGTQRGIFRVNKSELESYRSDAGRTINLTAYGRYDGLPSEECSGSYQPAACRTRDGRLMFSTLNGVVSVNPDEVSVNTLPPLVVIENALVDGTVQPPQPLGNRAKPTLIVPPGKRFVDFEFTALSFASPDRVRFRYQLKGLNRGWIEAGTLRSVRYNFLPPGHYTFLVTACNNDGVWNEHGAELGLIVEPHFYETWWFKVLIVVGVIVGVVIAVRRIGLRRLRRKLEIVERQRAVERDRARIAKDIHDDLGAGLTHISLLSELARRDSVENVHNHVGQISEMARELTRSMDEIVWAVDPHNDSLDSLVTYVTKFAQEYLSVAGIRCRLDLPAELPGYSLRAEVRHNLFLAIKETLNNVVKHARASEVWLRLVLEPHSFTVSIEDNGCGISDDAKSGESSSIGRISSGHGLDNLKKRLEIIGGKCVITSKPSEGTRVELKVNLSRGRSPELATGSDSKLD